MACNCKANEQILNLQRRFGTKVKAPISDKIQFFVVESIKMILLFLILIPFIPIAFIGLLIMNLTGNNRINLNRLINILTNRKGNE